MLLHQIDNSLGNFNYNAHIYSSTIWPLHFHGNYELIYTIDGATEITVNGAVDTLEAGYYILLSPYSTHSLKVSASAHTWVGVFSRDYISDFAKKHQFISFNKFKCDREFEAFLTQNLLHEGETAHFRLMACLCLICDQCIKNGSPIPSDRDTDFIKSVIIYLTEKLEADLSMREAADKLNYEYHYFSALFHKYFSMNFKSFINALRFEKACEMLLNEKYSVTEVSNKCGFSSIRNFNRVFKELAGITPTEYKGTNNGYPSPSPLF